MLRRKSWKAIWNKRILSVFENNFMWFLGYAWMWHWCLTFHLRIGKHKKLYFQAILFIYNCFLKEDRFLKKNYLEEWVNFFCLGGDSKIWKKVLPGESMGKNIYNSLFSTQIHFPVIWAPAVQKFLPKGGGIYRFERKCNKYSGER